MSVLLLALAASSSTVTPQRLMRWMIMRRGQVLPLCMAQQPTPPGYLLTTLLITQKLPVLCILTGALLELRWASAGTGDFYIEVPFACANINSPLYQPMHGLSIVHHDGFFNVTNVIAKIEQNSNRVYFYQTGSTTPLTWSNLVQSKFISMQLTYNAET
jgi:hypothetical protein